MLSEKSSYILQHFDEILWFSLRELIRLPGISVYLKDSDCFGNYIIQAEYKPYHPKHKGKRRGRFMYDFYGELIAVPNQKHLIYWVDPQNIQFK